MDPTNIDHHIESNKPTFKRKWSECSSKLSRWIWILIIVFIVVEGILVTAKLLGKRPNERMCWDSSMCGGYCPEGIRNVCLQPEIPDTGTLADTLKLLFTAKRNIVEILYSNQSYCACEYTKGEEKRLEVFYNFYVTND
ncbi:MAG: hypothetical protein WC505_02410 [Patescibacteria group bacterium]